MVDQFMTGNLTPEKIDQSTGGMVKFNMDAEKALDSLNKTGELDELKKLGISMDSSTMKFDNIEKFNQAVEDTISQGKSDWRELRRLSVDPEISDSAFDSAISKTSFNILVGLDSDQRRKFVANSSLFISSAVQNLPLMMFILLPFFAFLLWIINYRSKKFYVEHLIHGLHLHSFAYIVYGLAILWIVKVEIGIAIIFIASFIWVTTYTYLSMKNVSKQGWFKTLLKLWILGFFYFTVLMSAVTLELYISLITF